MATYYINADTGDDTTGDGSSATPWLTLYKGYLACDNGGGDTLYMQNSTAPFPWGMPNYSGKGITYEGESIDGVIIEMGATGNYRIVTGKTCIVRKVTFDFTSAGATLFYTTGTCIFLVENCKIIGGTKKFAAPYGPSTGSATIRNCEFICNLEKTIPGIDFAGAGLDPFCFITGCTFVTRISTTSQWFYGYQSASKTSVKNCIFINEGAGNVSVFSHPASQPADLVFQNNCGYNMYNWSNIPNKTNCIEADPLFVSTATDNFALRPTSPCIGTGVAI